MITDETHTKEHTKQYCNGPQAENTELMIQLNQDKY